MSVVETVHDGVEIAKNGCNGVEMDKASGTEMDKTDHLRDELVNTDVTPHQVVIVNPFPSPVPPKVPIVNVTSNCQCDRFASLAKNSGTGGKKKGRAKKGTGASGQKTGASASRTGTSFQNNTATAQKNGAKSKKVTSRKVEDGGKGKQSLRVVSAGKKGKKKLKEIQNADVKEISVIQTELKSDLNEENDFTPRKEDDMGTGIESAPVRQTTFIKEKFSVLSPIPEASRSGSSVEESHPELFSSNSGHTSEIPSISGQDRFVINGDMESEILSIPEQDRSVINGDMESEILSIPEQDRSVINGDMESIRPRSSIHTSDVTSTEGQDISLIDTDIPPGYGTDIPSGYGTDIDSSLPETNENEDNTIKPTIPSRLSKNIIDDSQPSSSVINGRVSDDDLDELIEEILNETDELEKNHAKSHVSHNTNTKEHVVTESDNTNVNAANTELLANSKNNTDIPYQSKETLVSNWLLQQNCQLFDYDLDASENHRNLSEHNSDASDSTRNSSENHRGPSDFLRAVPSDTIATDYSTFSDDICGSTSGRADVTSGRADVTSDRGNITKKTLGTSSETMSEKTTVSGPQSEQWTTSSLTISLPTNNGISLNEEVRSNVVGLVHSRLSRRKSETSGTGSELTSSEEEEIVWRKGNMLGKGAFGKVYCGLTNTGQMIAVKQVELITSNMEEAERQYEKLQEEVALLKSLRHENVVSYLGTCLDGGVVNIFMQFVPGGSIASILARFGPLEERVFRYYTKQILVGVEYLHRNNVVHRDIKGGNIMLMPTGVIKLIDFGCAKRLYMNMSQSQGDLLRSMKGTPYWMAPEVIRETGYGRKSDIWSIGCTVFEMATGKPPWSHLPPMSAILAIGQGSEPPKLDKPNSDDACDFVAISMARDPDKRWSSEELLRHRFILQCDDQR
ncbi:Mitogen-activated kinase kinase kinase 19 [Paramuricea clavata]|uniref:Mitogen-activated protein kinase kinase kinase 19 n=1 Tax=Paramuricea clavata TaxID=317549 RepID=A0A6S7GHN0_PARCT|nr:Mitogen-activated kinase kinase kinase 19 [Paramuricea clavata]